MSMTETLLTLLVIGVGFVAFLLDKAIDHLKAIRALLNHSANGRMENEAFIERMHKIAVSSEATAKHLQSIEQRIEPFTENRLQRLFSDLGRAVGSADKKNLDE